MRIPSALVLSLALLAACGEDPAATGGEPASSPTATAVGRPAQTPTPTRSRDQQPGTRIVARASDFGTVLFDATGQAIYVFDVERTSRPQCYGACAEAWPPVLTEDSPVAGDRVRASLLGTTRRRDGTRQVTYAGQPLYFYAHEGKGVVECHDVFLNGGTWYAVQPDGNRAP